MAERLQFVVLHRQNDHASTAADLCLRVASCKLHRLDSESYLADVPVQLSEARVPVRDRALPAGTLTKSLCPRGDERSTCRVTDVGRITELEEQLRQRDARLAEIDRTVDELRKVIEAWRRGHRVRPGGKISRKPHDKERTTGRGPGRPEGHEGTGRRAPASADRDLPVPVPETCVCGGIIDPTDEEPGEQYPVRDPHEDDGTALLAGDRALWWAPRPT